MTDGQNPPSVRFEGGHPTGGRLWRILVVTLFLILFAGFMALGIWQVQRLGWKLALIERVETRVHAAPVEAPAPDVTITRDDHEYLRVKASGRFRYDAQVAVKAVTELGGGWWVLTPLETRSGFTVLVNRGFVPQDMKADLPEGPQDGEVVGLLRLSEPKGGFLRENDANLDNWFSRDVDAIAAAKGLKAAPYFIDAQTIEGADPAAFPRAGMTVIKFANSHLVYALTWFGLAAGSLVGMVLFLRERRRKEMARH
ncbi:MULTISPECIES: SURF1 family protein [unclassified Brevundimonas]|uniref:SURF1 family protein n=1 Tax=unclassified Brevundimonas TaxID=2622653 RepID=UPI0025C6A7C5|nr:MULTISPECIES: SURF1 family protein [unclassified Brevundimonas]